MYRERNLFHLVFGLFLLLPAYLWGGVRIYKEIVFNINCDGRLKRTADANTIELATAEMEAAVSYLEKNTLTSGYTSVLWRTPNEDVGFWYKNLKTSLEELKKVRPDATQLEKSNVLIKLRETLLDEGQRVSVTIPPGIEVFPYNGTYAFMGILSLIFAVIGLALIWVWMNAYPSRHW